MYFLPFWLRLRAPYLSRPPFCRATLVRQISLLTHSELDGRRSLVPFRRRTVPQTVSLGQTGPSVGPSSCGDESARRTTEGIISGRSHSSQWRLAENTANCLMWSPSGRRGNPHCSGSAAGTQPVCPSRLSLQLSSRHLWPSRTGLQTCARQIHEAPGHQRHYYPGVCLSWSSSHEGTNRPLAE